MIQIKCTKSKLFLNYLNWINPVLKLSKGEIDILSNYLTLHYAHKYYDPKVLNEMLFSDETKEIVRKKLKINTRLFNKLFNSLVEKELFKDNKINPALTKYPSDGNFKLFISFKVE